MCFSSLHVVLKCCFLTQMVFWESVRQTLKICFTLKSFLQFQLQHNQCHFNLEKRSQKCYYQKQLIEGVIKQSKWRFGIRSDLSVSLHYNLSYIFIFSNNLQPLAITALLTGGFYTNKLELEEIMHQYKQQRPLCNSQRSVIQYF